MVIKYLNCLTAVTTELQFSFYLVCEATDEVQSKIGRLKKQKLN